MLKISGGIIEILTGKINWPFPSQFLPASLLGVLLQQEQTVLVDESGMSGTQMRSTTEQ
jgi:hypothetical protein